MKSGLLLFYISRWLFKTEQSLVLRLSWNLTMGRFVTYVLIPIVLMVTPRGGDRSSEQFGGLNVSQKCCNQLKEDEVDHRCFVGNTFNGEVCPCKQIAIRLCCDECDASEVSSGKAFGCTTEVSCHLGWIIVHEHTKPKLPGAVEWDTGIARCRVVSKCDGEWFVNYFQRKNASLKREPNSREALAMNATLGSTCKDTLLQYRGGRNKDDRMTLCTSRVTDRQVQEITAQDVPVVCYNSSANPFNSNEHLFHPICLDVIPTSEEARLETLPSQAAAIANATLFARVYCLFSNDSTFYICTYSTNNWLNETSHFWNKIESSVYGNAINEVHKIQLYLSYVTGAASAICIGLTVIVFFVDQGPRSCFEKCKFLLATTLLVTQVIGYVKLCIVSYADSVSDMVMCIFRLVLLYGSQSFFYWTSVLSYDIWRSLRALELHPGGCKRLTVYSTLSWGGAALQFGIAFVIYRTTDPARDSDEKRLLQAFAYSKTLLWTCCIFPVFLFLVNACFCLHTVAVVRKTQRESGVTVARRRTRGSSLRLFVKLVFIMCMTGVARLVIAVRFTILGGQKDSLGLLVFECIICLTIAIAAMPGVYLFFGFRDHVRLYSIIVKRGARGSKKDSVQSALSEVKVRA